MSAICSNLIAFWTILIERELTKWNIPHQYRCISRVVRFTFPFPHFPALTSSLLPLGPPRPARQLIKPLRFMALSALKFVALLRGGSHVRFVSRAPSVCDCCHFALCRTQERDEFFKIFGKRNLRQAQLLTGFSEQKKPGSRTFARVLQN